jgi:hypothetical protein
MGMYDSFLRVLKWEQLLNYRVSDSFDMTMTMTEASAYAKCTTLQIWQELRMAAGGPFRGISLTEKDQSNGNIESSSNKYIVKI